MTTKNTIEAHYQALKTAMDAARADLGVLGKMGDLAGRRDLLDEVCAAATEYAAETWADTRCRIAQLRGNMPAGPAVYTSHGPGYGHICGSVVSSNRSEETLEGERKTHFEHGVRVVISRTQKRLDVATRRFVAYADLVAQGVALAPDKGES